MTRTKALLGLAAACAACCAIPIALPAVVAAAAGFGLLGVGSILPGWWMEIGGITLVGIAGVAYLLRRRAAPSCARAEP